MQPGTVSFEVSQAANDRPVPLSAGGALNVYASVINQDGVLRAPIGAINLGWDGAGTAPVDPITGQAVPTTQSLTLAAGSVTSVSGTLAGTISGTGLPIPYGIDLNGTSWIDPTGTDITNIGPPQKLIELAGANVTVASGATVDATGGGDLYAYQFIPGAGGENDILLASSNSFAVIPGYLMGYAPYAAYNSNQTSRSTGAPNLLYPDPGYASASLAAGEQIHVDLGNGEGPQNYTLLPARYALLPGAYLITPLSKTAIPPPQPAAQPDGSIVAGGYSFNGFDPSKPLYSEFQVSPESVVRNAADYGNFSANTLLHAKRCRRWNERTAASAGWGPARI